MELIERQIAEGEAILSKGPLTEDECAGWRTHTAGVLKMVYGVPCAEIGTFHNSAIIMRQPHGHPFRDPVYVDEGAERMQALRQQLVRLRAFVKILMDEVASVPPVEPETVRGNALGSKVFLVHGRDPVRDKVARFIEKLKLDVTILDEQPNQGRTLIKKFEDHAGEARFAVVLLTADDVGALRADLVMEASAEAILRALRPRARQNVIFELGYFRAKLGEGNVCALCDEGIEIPSDFGGVSFVPLSGDWGLRLARELKAAKMPVDMNDAIG